MTPRLASICDDLDIRVIPTTKHRDTMETCALQTLERILAEFGEGHLTLVLRSIVETGNNKRELVAPVIWALSDVIRAHPSWPTTTAWLDALDECDLAEFRSQAKANRRAAQPRAAISTMLFERLARRFRMQERLL